MLRTAITPTKFKMCPFLDGACSSAEKSFTDINLPPLIPDEDNNFSGSLVMMTSRVTQELITQYEVLCTCASNIFSVFRAHWLVSLTKIKTAQVFYLS